MCLIGSGVGHEEGGGLEDEALGSFPPSLAGWVVAKQVAGRQGKQQQRER